MMKSNKRKDRWIDSETDLLSSSSDNDSQNLPKKFVNIEINESSKENCCLICSISPSLSNVNCCSKHLKLLNTKLPKRMDCMMSKWPRFECHCRLPLKPRQRFRSLSLSSTKSRHWRKQNAVILTSFNTNGLLLSPNRERLTSSDIESQRTSNHVSPSLINSTMNNNNNNHSRKRTLSSPIITKRKQRKIDQTESIPGNQSTSVDLVELDSELLPSPRIRLKRVIHVKDENEELINTNHQITLNMAQATQQMRAQKNTQPKILLKRVCFEQ